MRNTPTRPAINSRYSYNKWMKDGVVEAEMLFDHKIDPDENHNRVKSSVYKPIKKEVRLRIPDWCRSYRVAVNGEEITPVTIEKGYVVIQKRWKEGDEITLKMDMRVVMVASAPQVKENIGKRAVQRGPLVYCAEGDKTQVMVHG